MVNNAKLKGRRHKFHLPPYPPQVSTITLLRFPSFCLHPQSTYFPQNLVCSFKDDEDTKRGKAKVKVVWEPPKGKFIKYFFHSGDKKYILFHV